MCEIIGPEMGCRTTAGVRPEIFAMGVISSWKMSWICSISVAEFLNEIVQYVCLQMFDQFQSYYGSEGIAVPKAIGVECG